MRRSQRKRTRIRVKTRLLSVHVNALPEVTCSGFHPLHFKVEHFILKTTFYLLFLHESTFELFVFMFRRSQNLVKIVVLVSYWESCHVGKLLRLMTSVFWLQPWFSTSGQHFPNQISVTVRLADLVFHVIYNIIMYASYLWTVQIFNISHIHFQTQCN